MTLSGSRRLGCELLNRQRKRLVAGLKRHLAVLSIDIGECHLAEHNGILIHIADTLSALAVDIEFDLRVPAVDRDDRKGSAVIDGRAGPTADQRVTGGGILGENRGLYPRLGNLPWRLKRKLERRLLPVARGDRHIAEADGILADGGSTPFGMAVVGIGDLRRIAVDAQDIEFNRQIGFFERTLPVPEQIALMIEPLIDGQNSAGARSRSNCTHHQLPSVSHRVSRNLRLYQTTSLL